MLLEVYMKIMNLIELDRKLKTREAARKRNITWDLIIAIDLK